MLTHDVENMFKCIVGHFFSSEDLLLDFGSDVPLGANKKCYVYVKNNSAITAPFRLNVEHFYAKPPTPPDGRPDAYMPR